MRFSSDLGFSRKKLPLEIQMQLFANIIWIKVSNLQFEHGSTPNLVQWKLKFNLPGFYLYWRSIESSQTSINDKKYRKFQFLVIFLISASSPYQSDLDKSMPSIHDCIIITFWGRLSSRRLTFSCICCQKQIMSHFMSCASKDFYETSFNIYHAFGDILNSYKRDPYGKGLTFIHK